MIVACTIDPLRYAHSASIYHSSLSVFFCNAGKCQTKRDEDTEGETKKKLIELLCNCERQRILRLRCGQSEQFPLVGIDTAVSAHSFRDRRWHLTLQWMREYCPFPVNSCYERTNLIMYVENNAVFVFIHFSVRPFLCSTSLRLSNVCFMRKSRTQKRFQPLFFLLSSLFWFGFRLKYVSKQSKYNNNFAWPTTKPYGVGCYSIIFITHQHRTSTRSTWCAQITVLADPPVN